MPKIILLSDHLISQIAAGEVLERPASAVKELVENSLDAGATEVKVELEAGGKRRIVITDDGSGMGRDDALLAFDRHATSKIRSFEDLERVGTLGFRGEALASIAAVARVEMLTAEAPGEGHRVRIEGGRVVVAEPAPRARGTTLEIASLFFNVPARRKFLKTPQTELRRCVEVVQGYALARPDVRFSVVSEGRALLEALPVTEGVEGGRERIGQVFGAALARELVPIPQGGAEGESISGFVGKPAGRQGRRLFVFVNRRLLRDRSVLATFYRAVRDEWKSDDYPPLFLFLDLPPDEVDVNVHPQKAEVRFRDPGVLNRLYEVLRRALEKAKGEVAAPLREPWARPKAPFAWQGLGETQRGYTYPPIGPGNQPSEVREGPVQSFLTETGSLPGGGGSPWPPAQSESAGMAGAESPAESAARRLAAAAFAPEERAPVPLSGRSGETRPFRLLGQYKGTLILLEGPDGLYLIDQHVAHERLLYERLRRDLARESTPSQGLLEPLLLEASPAEILRLGEMAEALDACGFGIAPLSGGELAVTAVPAALGQQQAVDTLLALAADGSTDADAGAEGLRQQLLESLAASLSCRNAVKMHHKLTAEEMESLVTELFQAEQPFACPHGRPIVLQMTDADLERRFGRR